MSATQPTKAVAYGPFWLMSDLSHISRVISGWAWKHQTFLKKDLVIISWRPWKLLAEGEIKLAMRHKARVNWASSGVSDILCTPLTPPESSNLKENVDYLCWLSRFMFLIPCCLACTTLFVQIGFNKYLLRKMHNDSRNKDEGQSQITQMTGYKQ